MSYQRIAFGRMIRFTCGEPDCEERLTVRNDDHGHADMGIRKDPRCLECGGTMWQPGKRKQESGEWVRKATQHLEYAAIELQRAADSSPDPARAVVLRRAAANISVEIERIR